MANSSSREVITLGSSGDGVTVKMSAAKFPTQEAEFESDFAHLREQASIATVKWYGDRCEDFDEDCLCCRQWKILDELFENPFKASEQEPPQ